MSAEHATAEKESGVRTNTQETTVAPETASTPEGLLIVSRSPRNATIAPAATFFAQRKTRGQHALVMRTIQRTHGNRFAQRVVAQLRLSAQRQCHCGGTCESCKSHAATAPLPAETQIVQAQSNGDMWAATLTASDLRPSSSSGEPLEPEVRESMEAHFGRDLGGVRIHAGAPAARAAESIQADAYTIGRDVYFGEGKYDPSSFEGRRLLAHELTHVQQQEAGAAPTEAAASANGDVLIGLPHDPLEKEAETNAASFSAADQHEQPKSVSPDSTGAVRRAGWNSLSDNPIINTVRSGANTAAVGVSSGLRRGRDVVLAQMERLAPGVVSFFRNIKDYFKNAISNGVNGLFGGIVASIREKGLAATLANLIGSFASGAVQVAGGFIAGECAVMGKVAGYLLDLQRKIGVAAFDQVKKGFETAGAVLGNLWTEYGAPSLDFVKKKLKSIWTDVEREARRFWDLLKPLREGVAELWNEVTDFLIESRRSFNDWLEWFVPKALDAWEKLKEKLKPFMQKVKAAAKIVGIVLLLLPPHGPFVLLGVVIYGLYQGVKALWDRWGKGFTRDIRQWWVNEGLPRVQSTLKSFRTTVDSVKRQIQGVLNSVHSAIVQVLDALGVLSFLSSVKNAIDGFAKKVDTFKEQLDKKFAEWSGKIQSLIARADPYIQQIKEALRQTLLVTLFGPFSVLDDRVWNTVLRLARLIMRTPCLREINGLLRLPSFLARVGRLRLGIKAAWGVIKNPDPLLAKLREAIAPMVANIEPRVRSTVSNAYTDRELFIQVSVMHYLSESLSELRTNWWEQLKKMGGDLLWPWDEVGKEFMPMLEDFGAAIGAVFDLEFNTATDKFLSGMKRFNTMVGALSGWFLLASVLIGAALGALGFITGPGGVATVGAGASAGLAFAEEVGIGLLVIALATEAAVMEKANFDLRFQNPRIADAEAKVTADQEDCKAIAGSLISVITVGALMLLGAIAQKFASFLAGLANRVPLIRDIGRLLRQAREDIGNIGIKPGRPTAGRGAHGEPIPRETGVPDPDTTAKPGEFTPEQLDTANRNLAERINDPRSVREVTDPKLRDKYDVEVDLGDGQTYRRRKDGTWCLFRNPTECGVEVDPAINQAADQQKQRLETETNQKESESKRTSEEDAPGGDSNRTSDEGTSPKSSKEGAPEGARTEDPPSVRAAKQQRYRELQNKGTKLSQSEIEELQGLRRDLDRLGDELVMDTPDHKAQRWEDYKQRPTTGEKMDYDSWSDMYDRNMQNNKVGLGREQSYRDAYNGKSRVLETSRGKRQVDVFIDEPKPGHAIEIKTGKVNLETTAKRPGRISVEEAIARDAELVAQGYKVTWILEKDGSAPLKAALEAAGIEVKIGKQIP